MMTYVHVWYLAPYFLEWEVVYTEVLEKIETGVLCSTFFLMLLPFTS